jgi:RNA polymerase sigma-70 factor (ECF subfamily)
MIDDTGEELMARMAAGDREAFALLYRRYRPDVYRFAAHFCGSLAQAEDIVQDVFLAVIQHAARYRPERSAVLPWLLGIARNYSRRRRSERPMLPLPVDDAPSGRELSIELDPLAGITRDRQAVALRRALGELPCRYREVIVLCDLHDLTYLDAASALGCAIGTVRSRLHRGRALLARRLSYSEQPVTSRLPATRAIL